MKEQTVAIFGAGTPLGLEVCLRLKAADHVVIGIGHQPKAIEQIEANGITAVQLKYDNFDALRHFFEAKSVDVIVNLEHQQANTLLHDGHLWPNLVRHLVNNTDALLDAAQVTQVSFFLHCSFAFVNANQKNKMIEAALDAEQLVQENGVVPYSTLRLGYLYGPQINDMALYELSFKMKRPYYAGSADHRANFVYLADAVEAIVLAIEKQVAGATMNVVDGSETLSFTQFINQYASALGRGNPRRLPTWLAKWMPLLITPQQIEQLSLTHPKADYTKTGELLGWSPKVREIQDGLQQSAQVVLSKA